MRGLSSSSRVERVESRNSLLLCLLLWKKLKCDRLETGVKLAEFKNDGLHFFQTEDGGNSSEPFYYKES